MKTILGADDAGRGPVLGPMVLAAVVINEEDSNSLKSIGVKDSKLLTSKQRDDLYQKIIEIVKSHKIIIITPQEIDNAIESENSNLNTLEATKFAELINSLKADVSIIDCPSNNIPAYTAQLEKMLTVKTDLQCHHKADSKFLSVGAASIIAKVTRDKEIEKIQKKIKEPIGSGYPSDPLTKEFLKNNWDKHPEIFRHSWATYKVYSEGKESKKQKKLGEY